MTNPGPSNDWAAWRRTTDLGSYDARWRQMEAAGQNPHGEVDLVCTFAPQRVLDAGCGTGRVAIELARRGVSAAGVDLDADMLAVARTKAPDLIWFHADLAALGDVAPETLGGPFDVVVAAGNVIRFVNPADRAAAVAGCAAQLAPGGVLIAGYQLLPAGPSLADYDLFCAAVGLELAQRWATWDGAPFTGSDYAVSVHRKSS